MGAESAVEPALPQVRSEGLGVGEPYCPARPGAVRRAASRAAVAVEAVAAVELIARREPAWPRCVCGIV